MSCFGKETSSFRHDKPGASNPRGEQLRLCSGTDGSSGYRRSSSNNIQGTHLFGMPTDGFGTKRQIGFRKIAAFPQLRGIYFSCGRNSVTLRKSHGTKPPVTGASAPRWELSHWKQRRKGRDELASHGLMRDL